MQHFNTTRSIVWTTPPTGRPQSAQTTADEPTTDLSGEPEPDASTLPLLTKYIYDDRGMRLKAEKSTTETPPPPGPSVTVTYPKKG